MTGPNNPQTAADLLLAGFQVATRDERGSLMTSHNPERTYTILRRLQ
jgi:hypothetical protein